MSRGNQTHRQKLSCSPFPSLQGWPEGAIWLCRRQQGMLQQGMLQRGMLQQGMPSVWLPFFIAIAKSASENSTEVPTESLTKAKPPTSRYKITQENFKKIWIYLCHDTESSWSLWVPELAASAVLAEAEAYVGRSILYVYHPAKVWKAWEAWSQKAWKLAGLSSGRFWLMAYKEQTPYYT